MLRKIVHPESPRTTNEIVRRSGRPWAKEAAFASEDAYSSLRPRLKGPRRNSGGAESRCAITETLNWRMRRLDVCHRAFTSSIIALRATYPPKASTEYSPARLSRRKWKKWPRQDESCPVCQKARLKGSPALVGPPMVEGSPEA